MLKDVKGVGQRDALKEVSDGYALNFLIAQGLAVQATPEKVAAHAEKKQLASASAAEQAKVHEAQAKKITGVTVTVSARANDKGHLYEHLALPAIAAALGAATGVHVTPEAIVLAEHIKSTGESQAEVRLGVSKARFTVNVTKAEK